MSDLLLLAQAATVVSWGKHASLRLPHGWFYTGDIAPRKGIFTGLGYAMTPDGRRIEGGWRAGKLHGKMTISKNGKRLVEGCFYEGKAHGSVTFWDDRGRARKVLYNNGVRINPKTTEEGYDDWALRRSGERGKRRRLFVTGSKSQ